MNKAFSYALTSFGAFVAIFFLGANTSCSFLVDIDRGRIPGDAPVLCTIGCGTSFSAGFGGTGGDAGTGGAATGGSSVGGGGVGGSSVGGTTTTSTVEGGGGVGGTVVGGGGAGGGCEDGFKSCGDACVAMDDPDYGCAEQGCAPCDLANATAVCESGVCAIEACDSGYDDCVNGADDGCETHLLSDPLHCGACADAACEAYPNQQCIGGLCQPGCGVANAPVPMQGYALCYTILANQHSPGNVLAVGGQYTDSADQGVSVFPFPGCSAANAQQHHVLCGLDLKPGTELGVLMGYVGP
ncbi:hypothetical protein L0Y59_03880, partial [Candidatus Uhrbacteria bacterium]|nr:hypothetical protein [Candidatus Uhrbacteria bacterium]